MLTRRAREGGREDQEQRDHGEERAAGITLSYDIISYN